jgi:hypothetical protein
MISNKVKENHKSTGIKENKAKNLVELIEIIEHIKKQQNKNPIKIINKEKSLKEKKDLEELPKVNNKKTFRRWEKNYISLIQNIIYEKLFYDSTSGFDYDNYKISITQKKQEIFTQFYNGINILSREIKNYDSPILDNHKVDDILEKIKVRHILGQVTSDYIVPDGISPDDFDKFKIFKQVNRLWISTKYALSL